MDACTLYPAPLRDFLVELAVSGLFRAKWTDRIHDEWISSLLIKRPDLTRDSLERTKALMNENVLDCLVEGYEDIAHALELPDPNCQIASNFDPHFASNIDPSWVMEWAYPCSA